MALELTSAFDLTLVPSESNAVRHLMFGVRAPEGTTRRMPINLALVLDTSGSMNGEKLRHAREAAERVVRHLSSADRVALIAYADRAEVIAPATILDAVGRANLLCRISRLDAEGSTNLSGGWLLGCQEIAKYADGDGGGTLCRALVLTDGLANVGIVDTEELVGHARELKRRGITTSTMGLGADFNEDLLEALARHGGGRFQYVETAKHVPDCVQGELGELAEIAARQVALDIRLPDGVSLVECMNEYASETTAAGVRLQLGDVLAGETRRAVLKLRVAPRSVGDERTIQAVAYYVDVASGLGTDKDVPSVAFRSATEADIAGETSNAEVVAEIARLMAARARDAAARASRAGEDEVAASILANAGRALRTQAYASAPIALFEASSLEAMVAEAATGLRESQRKEMRYQSYLARETRKRYDGSSGKA